MRSEIRCEVCEQTTAKYKCPKCRTPYCRLACYKTHISNTEVCDSVALKQRKKEESRTESSPWKEKPEESSVEQTDAETNSECVLTSEQLEAIKHSDWIRTALHDSHIRQQLKHIHGSVNPRRALETALENSQMAEFMYGTLDELAAK